MPSNLEKIKREKPTKKIPMSQVFHVPSNLVKVKREEATKKFLSRSSDQEHHRVIPRLPKTRNQLRVAIECHKGVKVKVVKWC